MTIYLPPPEHLNQEKIDEANLNAFKGSQDEPGFETVQPNACGRNSEADGIRYWWAGRYLVQYERPTVTVERKRDSTEAERFKERGLAHKFEEELTAIGYYVRVFRLKEAPVWHAKQKELIELAKNQEQVRRAQEAADADLAKANKDREDRKRKEAEANAEREAKAKAARWSAQEWNEWREQWPQEEHGAAAAAAQDPEPKAAVPWRGNPGATRSTVQGALPAAAPGAPPKMMPPPPPPEREARWQVNAAGVQAKGGASKAAPKAAPYARREDGPTDVPPWNPAWRDPDWRHKWE